MNIFRMTATIPALALATGLIGAAPVIPPPPLNFHAHTGSFWKLEWEGTANRTTFVQFSLDLDGLEYAPQMDFGTGSKYSIVDTENEPKFFIRVHYLDAAWVDTMLRARLADFDNDGIPNYYEVETEGTDPFIAEPFVDSDSDGISDRYELFHFGSLTGGSAGLDTDGDGYDNGFEAAMGMDSTVGITTAVLSELEIHLPN